MVKYRYCTEFVTLLKPGVVKDSLEEALSPMGNSIVAVMGHLDDKHVAKVHMHASDPSAVFTKAREFSPSKTLLKEKVDDMVHQIEEKRHQELFGPDMTYAKCNILTTTCSDVVFPFFAPWTLKFVMFDLHIGFLVKSYICSPQ